MQKKKEFIRAIKYLLLTASAGAIQIVSFTVLNETAHLYYWLSYGIALTLSVIWNFTFNRKFTFKSANNVPVAMLKVLIYYAVFTPLTMLLEDYLTGLGLNEYLVTLINMLLNVSTEFPYQTFFVFRNSIDQTEKICIENEKLKVKVSLLGAELCSINGKKTDTEYLWQGKKYWKGKAPVLFPICGRLFNGKYTYMGKIYSLPIHGIAKKTCFSVKERTENKVVLEAVSTEKTKKAYPFDFVLNIVYSLQESVLKQQFIVKNTGDKDMYFSFGGHPGFNVPFDKDENFEDYYLEFKNGKTFDRVKFNEDGLYKEDYESLTLEEGNKISLTHDLFNKDLFLVNDENTIKLKSDKSDKSLEVSFSDMTLLGFWQVKNKKPKYVCIEPWHGRPGREDVTDDITTKKDIIKLEKGKEFIGGFDIKINE